MPGVRELEKKITDIAEARSRVKQALAAENFRRVRLIDVVTLSNEGVVARVDQTFHRWLRRRKAAGKKACIVGRALAVGSVLKKEMERMSVSKLKKIHLPPSAERDEAVEKLKELAYGYTDKTLSLLEEKLKKAKGG
ncbi:hypothetical protein HY991_02525 [Candidatus Micrarchaeota archaeon]|nr:hypothetical protein [Candidatus Micrarchaeota archaeon]